MFYIFLIFSLHFAITNEFFFPKSRYDIFRMRWVYCSNGSLIEPHLDNGTLQLRIDQNGLCQGAFSSELPNEEGIYIYSFIFDRTVDSNSLLIISIDGRNYTVTNTSKYISVRHKHLITCNNTIDFILLSGQEINLISFHIINNEQVQRNQIINYQFLNSSINVGMFTWIQRASKIENCIISYNGYLNNSDPLLDIKIFYNNSIDKCVYAWVDNYTLLSFACKQKCEQQNYFSGLQFLIQRKYTIEYFYPGFMNISTVNQHYYFMDQIDQSDTTVKQFQQGITFSESDQMILLDYDLEIVNLTTFILKPKGQSICNYQFRFISITIKTSSQQFEYILEEYQSDKSNPTFQKKPNCQYYFKWEYDETKQYYIDMTLIIETEGSTTPIGYQISNYKMNQQNELQSPSWNFEIKDIVTIILMVILPIFISMIILLVCVCIVSPKYYLYPWLTIQEQEEVGDFLNTRDFTPSINRQQSDIIQVAPNQHQYEQQAILHEG